MLSTEYKDRTHLVAQLVLSELEPFPAEQLQYSDIIMKVGVSVAFVFSLVALAIAAPVAEMKRTSGVAGHVEASSIVLRRHRQ